eukprot:6489646-Amphidinium_carterae.2
MAWQKPGNGHLQGMLCSRKGSALSSMTRTRALGFPAHVKAKIVKSLFSVGVHGAEVGGISEQHMKDLRASALALRRVAALELMAHGGPIGDPCAVADLRTVCVWQRRIAAGKAQWPLSEVSCSPWLATKKLLKPGLRFGFRPFHSSPETT